MRFRLLPAALGVAALSLGGLAGCTTNPATGERVFTGFMSESQEVSLGRQHHPEIVRAFGGEYDSPELQRYVESIGQLLARTVERRDFEYTFTVLNSEIVNAFALPGGYIYVSRGLLALAGSEAELASVLAHELGHVNALHHGRRQGQSLLANVLIVGAGVAAGSAGQQVAQLGSVVAAGVLSSYSREHEREADSLGLRYMSRAGYDPQALAEFLRKMRDHARLEAVRRGRSPDEVDAFNYMATHPAPSERVQLAAAEAGQYRVAQPMLATDIYLDRLDGMLYGDDPEQGFVRGAVFAHPVLRFRFEVPEGFTLFNSAHAVTAQGPDGTAIIFDQAGKPSDGPVQYYLTDVWARGATLRNVETLQVNGLEAATATARVNTANGARDARLVAIRKDLQTIYRFVFLTQPGQTDRWAVPFRRTTHSFRILTEAEAGVLKPLRLRVVEVGPGDTVRTLAARMAGEGGHAEQRFRVLNGVRDNQDVRPGQRVKLVTE